MKQICVITARNSLQAETYEAELEWRRQHDLLFPNMDFQVIADPEPLGSAGATIHALRKLADEDKIQDTFVLILHSGGESSRARRFSVRGKLFAPLPSLEFPAIFDYMVWNLSCLPAMEGGYVIIASGDQVITGLDNVVFSETGFTGIAIPGSGDIASGHGSYIPIFGDDQPYAVYDFIQKPKTNDVSIYNMDTGIYHLAPDARDLLIADAPEGYSDLYMDIAYSLVGRSENTNFAFLDGMPFHVYVDKEAGFFHMGTDEDFLDNFYKLREYFGVMNNA